MEIKRFNLPYKETYEYFHQNVDKVNYLCSTLIERINFEKGIFFTILPKETIAEKMLQFRCGGIAQGMIGPVRQFLLGNLLFESKSFCILDNANAVYGDEREDFNYPVFQSNGLVLEEEVYYFIRGEDASLELVDSCFNFSNTLWHSLCVFARIDLEIPSDKKLKKEEIINICDCTKLIILRAYDGEGYVLWEKIEE